MVTLKSIISHGYKITITPTTFEGMIMVKVETKRSRLTCNLMAASGSSVEYDVLPHMSFTGPRNDMRELFRVFGIEI